MIRLSNFNKAHFHMWCENCCTDWLHLAYFHTESLEYAHGAVCLLKRRICRRRRKKKKNRMNAFGFW